MCIRDSQCIGQQGDLFMQVGNFICSLQAEVSAFYRCLRQMGQITQHRQAGLPFQQGLEHFIQPFGTIIEQDARNMAVFAEVHKALNLQIGRAHV